MNYMQIIPIIVTLAAAIVGTFWPTALWGKIALVTLAILASIATLWEVKNQSNKIIAAQGKLTSLVRIANPNETFSQDVLDAFREIAMEYGLPEGNINRLNDGNTIVHFRRKENSSICGVLRLSPLMVTTIFHKYSQQITSEPDTITTENSKGLIPYILPIANSTVTETEDHDELLTDIAYISQFPLTRDANAEISAIPTVSTDNNQNKIISVEIKHGRDRTQVTFDAKYLKIVESSTLLERGRLIFSKVWPDQAGVCDE